jgi:hypothetical protein
MWRAGLCSRLLADLIGDGRAEIVGFGDAQGALIEVASRSHVFQADGPNWRPASVGAVRPRARGTFEGTICTKLRTQTTSNRMGMGKPV